MSTHQLNILLVDGNKKQTITDDLLTKIKDWHCQADRVHIYEAALEQIARREHDLCFLDYQLGKARVLDLVRQIAENGISLPVVVLANGEDHEALGEVLEAGAVDYLLKNRITDSILTRSIRNALKWKLMQTQVSQLRRELEKHALEEETLRKSDKLYRKLFNMDVYGMEVSDAEGVIIDCNEAYQDIVGYSHAEIVGKHITAFTTQKSADMYKRRWPALREQGYIEGEVEVLRKDGSVTMVWWRSRAIYDEVGDFTGAVTYSRDITERMVAVEQISTLARALQHSPIPMMVTDTTGDIKYINIEFTDLTGYEEEDIIDHNMNDFKLWKQSLSEYDTLWKIVNNGEEWQDELQGMKKSEETYWVSVTVTPMFNTKGILTHFIVVLEDITYRKEAEAESLLSQQRVGDVVAEHITDLTTANEALQLEIAERKRAEDTLRRSRARLKAQYKGFPIPTYSWQRTGDDFMLVDYNLAAEKTIQGQIVNFMGKMVSEVFKGKTEILEDFNRCYEERKTIKRESFYTLLTTGETRYFVTTYNFIPPNLIVVHIEDITDTKRLEAKIQEYEVNYKDVSLQQTDELNKTKETLRREASERTRLEQELRNVEVALKKHEENLSTLVDERTAELTKVNKRLEKEIAERKRIEDSLRHNRARLEGQYRGIPVPTYSWQLTNGDFVLVDYNEAATTATHRRIVGFKGKTVREVFKDRPQVLADFRRCYREKRIVKRESLYRLLTTDKTRHFVTTYNFVPPDLIIVHIQDITEHKQVEKELKKYHDKLSGLATEHAADLIKANEALQNEVVRREQAEASLQQVQTELKEYQDKLATSSQAHNTELEELNTKLEAEIDKHKQMEEAFQQHQARLKAQYKGIPLPTYTWKRADDDFVLVDYNDAAEQTTQSRITNFMNKTAGEIFKERPRVLEDFNLCYKENAKIKRESLYRLLTTGETRHFVTTYNPVPPDMIIVHIQDITEYKQVEAASKEHHYQLEQLATKHATEIEKLNETLEAEQAKRIKVEQTLQAAQIELKAYQNKIENMIKERTLELEQRSEQLEVKLGKHERIEESLRKTRAKFKAQYKGIPVPTYSWQRIGEDFVLVDYNNAAERATQGRIADFMGKPITEVFKDRPQVLAAFDRCYREKTTIKQEGLYRMLTTGETRYYVTTYNFVLSNLIIVHIEDITEHKWTKEALHMSKEQIELRCRFSPDLKITFVNNAYCWYFNRRRDELIGLEIPFIFDEDLDELRAHFMSLNQENPVESIEHRVARNGDIRWLQWINRAIFDEDGRLIEIQSVGRDITGRKKGVMRV